PWEAGGRRPLAPDTEDERRRHDHGQYQHVGEHDSAVDPPRPGGGDLADLGAQGRGHRATSAEDVSSRNSDSRLVPADDNSRTSSPWANAAAPIWAGW